MRRVLAKRDVEAYNQREGATREAPVSPTPDDYLAKVAKYIPAEIVDAFVWIEGTLAAVPNATGTAHWVIFGLLIVFTAAYMWRISRQGTPPATKRTRAEQVVISTISFVVWVFALGGPFTAFAWYYPAWGSIVLAIWTLIPPLLAGN